MAERKQGLPKELVGHCETKEDKEAFIQQILGAVPVLNRYRIAINKRLEKALEVKETDYDCSAWSHKQADTNGYARAMREILKLLPKTNQEK